LTTAKNKSAKPHSSAAGVTGDHRGN